MQKFLAIRVGGGFAHSSLATFAGTDLGLVLGYVNPYVTPFLSGGVVASAPLQGGRRTLLDCTSVDSIHVLFEPVHAVMGEVTGGIRIALRETRQHRLFAGARLLFGFAMLHAALTSWTAFGGIEFVFGRTAEFPTRARR